MLAARVMTAAVQGMDIEIDERDRRRVELTQLLRVNGEIVPTRLVFAELLLDLARRKRLLDGQRKPLRALGELAHLAPYRLDSLLTSEIWPGRRTIEKLAALNGPDEKDILSSLGQATARDDDASLTAADQAVFEVIGEWPDEDKYELARHLRRVQAIGRANRSPE